MRLLVVDHLQAVLDPAQKAIGLDHLVGGLRVDMAGQRQGTQRRAGAAQPQRGVAAAEDELLGLGEELDLADAAAAQLDVVASTFTVPPPRWASICRLIEWMSWMAAKSRCLRQM